VSAIRRPRTRAVDVPDFAKLDAHVAETQAKVRRCFERIVGKA
jgi:glutamate-ammonia-ligase adenylyltransferase